MDILLSKISPVKFYLFIYFFPPAVGRLNGCLINLIAKEEPDLLPE